VHRILHGSRIFQDLSLAGRHRAHLRTTGRTHSAGCRRDQTAARKRSGSGLWMPGAASSGALKHGAEVIEVVGGVVRAGGGLRVVLDAEHRAVEQAQAF
jgi:hypothetical protein